MNCFSDNPEFDVTITRTNGHKIATGRLAMGDHTSQSWFAPSNPQSCWDTRPYSHVLAVGEDGQKTRLANWHCCPEQIPAVPAPHFHFELMPQLNGKRLAWIRGSGSVEIYTLFQRGGNAGEIEKFVIMTIPLVEPTFSQLDKAERANIVQRQFLRQTERELDQTTVEKIEPVESGSEIEDDCSAVVAIVDRPEFHHLIETCQPKK